MRFDNLSGINNVPKTQQTLIDFIFYLYSVKFLLL